MAEQTRLTKEELKKIIQEELHNLDEGVFSNLMKKAKDKVKSVVGGNKAASDSSSAKGAEASSSEEDKTTGDDDQKQAGSEGDAGEEIKLFTGNAALGQRMFSSIKSRGTNLDKKELQGVVKSVLKDLSAQLRANGLKVQESNNIYHSIFEKLNEQNEEYEGALEIMKDKYKVRSSGQIIKFLDKDTGLVPRGVPLTQAAVKDAAPGSIKKAKACKANNNCAKQYKMLRRANAELSKEYQRGGAEAEKAVRTGGRVKPQEGVLNVSQAIGGKLKSAGVDQKTITAIIVKMARPYFQKIFKQRGIEDVKIKESMVEDAAKSLITENKNIKIKIKRK